MGGSSQLRQGRTADFGRREDAAGCRLIRGQRGSVLLVLIITMVILSVLTAALLPTLFTTEMGQVSASGAMKAYYLAEAGGRYTLPRLGSIVSGLHTFKFSGGDTFFEIDKISNLVFTSTGVVDEGGTLEARVVITYRLKSTFDHGIFGDTGVTLGNSVSVDSYSSSGNTTDGNNGDVGTNGSTITVGNNVNIYGNQNLSAGKVLDLQALPTGAASWLSPPSDLNMSSNNQPVDLPAGQYSTAAVNITNNSTINITGDVALYIVGSITASNNSTLNINPGVSVTIYAGGDIDFSKTSLVNSDQIPRNFIIYGLAGCQSVALSGTHAAIYAPTADIVVNANSVTYGSLVGDTVTVGNNTLVHYDEDLQVVGSSGGGGNDVEQYFTEN